METPHVRVVATGREVCKCQRQPEDTDALGRNALNAAEPARPAEAWFTLNREWVIASCGDGVPGVLSQAVGRNIWEAFPGADTHFKPIYESGWKCGVSSGLVYWNGDITEVHTTRHGDSLVVSFEYLTVSGLRALVERMSCLAPTVTAPARSTGDQRRHLRALP